DAPHPGPSARVHGQPRMRGPGACRPARRHLQGLHPGRAAESLHVLREAVARPQGPDPQRHRAVLGLRLCRRRRPRQARPGRLQEGKRPAAGQRRATACRRRRWRWRDCATGRGFRAG
ncbi:MAG: hypothetical protein AVDCRST_MAG67-653, partial [uncultured Solirubrobacteraceae bacterium]